MLKIIPSKQNLPAKDRKTKNRERFIMSIISVTGLKKAYGEIIAVDGISIDIEKGQIFGLLGPNGAGKTTTINMLTGLARPTAGKIFVDGIDGIKNIKKVQRIIGIVPDESNLYDEMDSFDNLCFCASLYGIKKLSARNGPINFLRYSASKIRENVHSGHTQRVCAVN